MFRHLRYLAGAPVALAFAAHSLPAQGAGMPVAEQFKSLHFRSIGPAIMSGRIADLAVYEANPAIYYVGTAHGGVWKTTNNGATFIPQFQDEGLISIGDVTVSQTNPDLVWVGAGESNNRQSTSWGGGVYKSTNGGQTYQLMGLRDSKHINRIVIDPGNNDVVLVAATGPLFGPGGERGVFKTTDGGRTWKHVLRVDEWTGANDLVMSPTNPQILFASTYQRVRNACCMNGGGPGSGIWRSTDGGETWARLTGNGLPDGPLGRIAIDVFRRSGNFVYALIEGPSAGGRGFAPPAEGAEAAPGRGGRAGGAPQASPTTGLWRSEDGGNTWRFVNAGNPRPMYFSQVRVDPNSPDRVYLGGVGLWMTIDGGRTFEQDAALVTHDDVHAIWINPANSDHVLIGNDGGLAVSYDMSRTWTFLPNLPVGLFYHVGYDMEVPYNVCGGMQDNYNWCGPSATRRSRGILTSEWHQIQGGDGFVAIPDLRESRIVYTESQGGNMVRRDRITGESKSIRPSPQNVTNYTAGDTYRFFWDSPMIHSPHDPGTLLVAANKVFRSTDRGDSWTAISPDLTLNANRDTIVTMGVRGSDIRIATNDGISTWGTIVSLAESPAQAGVIWTGTDDGVVSVTRNGGASWQNVTANIPGYPRQGYTSEVVPSRYAAGTAYVTVDNHLLNDYAPYIWMTTDFGATWRSIVGNLRGENVRTLTEDHRNPNVLYIGTETGIFLTLDRGASWQRLKGRNFPTVRVDEITLHPRDNAMIVATHGRALWILDHLGPIQEYAAAQAASGEARLFSVPTALQWKSKDDLNDEFWGHQYFAGENPPTDAVIQFHLKRPIPDLKVRILTPDGRAVRTLDVPADRNVAGIQTVCWDQRV
ncbi:MAG: glycosyl hydrolase, partial [Gemmatimonadaceae bacterium]|nr:glycosyl hydrolase [Gemmatimonadaceae bacterium]